MNMTQNDNRKADDQLLKSVALHIVMKGIKATTMDTVAHTLGMSKRTLYEIFESKEEMVQQSLDYAANLHRREIDELFSSSSNVMEACVLMVRSMVRSMTMISPEFFLDMDRLYRRTRVEYQERLEKQQKERLKVFELGVHQGVFRTDVDYRFAGKLLDIQFESIKRIENLRDWGITFPEAARAIAIGFLRSVATPSGMEILDELCSKFDIKVMKFSDSSSPTQDKPDTKLD